MFDVLQESTRAGRDGGQSFSRIYYCKEGIESIINSEIAKAKYNNSNKEARARTDYYKMCDYCEIIACRHKLFSNYFGDDPPDCKYRCDVCKNQQEVEAAKEKFDTISSQSNPVTGKYGKTNASYPLCL